jgi:hypothetical protein
MPKHLVKANIQIHELSKAGASMSFDLFADDQKLGHMVIGRGTITWYGKNRKQGRELNWTKFAKLMDEACYDE